jgi:hypothetical protein
VFAVTKFANLDEPLVVAVLILLVKLRRLESCEKEEIMLALKLSLEVKISTRNTELIGADELVLHSKRSKAVCYRDFWF